MANSGVTGAYVRDWDVLPAGEDMGRADSDDTISKCDLVAAKQQAHEALTTAAFKSVNDTMVSTMVSVDSRLSRMEKTVNDISITMAKGEGAMRALWVIAGGTSALGGIAGFVMSKLAP